MRAVKERIWRIKWVNYRQIPIKQDFITIQLNKKQVNRRANTANAASLTESTPVSTHPKERFTIVFSKRNTYQSPMSRKITGNTNSITILVASAIGARTSKQESKHSKRSLPHRAHTGPHTPKRTFDYRFFKAEHFPESNEPKDHR